jgi:hypothetical protein
LLDVYNQFFAAFGQIGTKVVLPPAGQDSAPQSYSILSAKLPKRTIKVRKIEKF